MNLPEPTEQEILDYNKSIKILEDKYYANIEAVSNGAKVDAQYKQCLENIQSNNKKILILFHMDGCPGCIIYKYLFQYNATINTIINENYELILVNGQKTRTKLINKHNIYSFPFLVIIDHTEKVLKKNIGCNVIGGVENNLIEWLTNEQTINNSDVNV